MVLRLQPPDSTRPPRAAAALFLALVHAWPAQAQEVVPPLPVEQPEPSWPGQFAAEHDVVVPVIATVSAAGLVDQASVEAGVSPEFDDAALAAVRRWRFRPALVDGRPVAAKIRLLVRFREARAVQSRAAARDAASIQPIPPLPRRAKPASVQSRQEEVEVEVIGERVAPRRSASETSRGQDVISAAPHRTGGDLLQVVPGAYITQHSGQGKAYQVFYRGFDAVHGQDLEFWVGGVPVNEVSNIHGQGYADLNFVMPEVVSRISVLPGNYSPEQGDFAVAGTIRYDLGYEEPGVSAKATVGSFGERRIFLGYHPENAPAAEFLAFETQSTDGFGPNRAASRTSGIVQRTTKLGSGRLRLLATGYAGRFDSPGVVSLRDLESGRLDRFDTYGLDQGGYSSRYQGVVEYVNRSGRADLHVAPYLVWRTLKLKQNYTGYLLDEVNGDTSQLQNQTTTLGVTTSARQAISLLSQDDQLEVGVSLRHDRIDQSQLDVGNENSRVLGTIVDAELSAVDAAAWLGLTTLPLSQVRVLAGLRVDGLAYHVADQTPANESRQGADPNAFARQLRPPSPGGQVRTAMGAHWGPRVTVDSRLSQGVHGVLAYGEGFRSPQARSLGDGERTPFVSVRSMEAGLRYGKSPINGSLSVFRTDVTGDLVFDAATTRNERVPASRRLGAALEYVVKPDHWFVSSGSGTFTKATFTESDRTFASGDSLPYVPELVLRQDIAWNPSLARIGNRSLTGRFGMGLTGVFRRPQPYGTYGHDVVLFDLTSELRFKEIALGVDVFNLLDQEWYDSEFTYSANWNPAATARLVPERYVTVGAPRTLLVTLSAFVN